LEKYAMVSVLSDAPVVMASAAAAGE
jgi:hypothetical protein